MKGENVNNKRIHRFCVRVSPTRAVVETVDEVSPPTLVETERGKAPEK